MNEQLLLQAERERNSKMGATPDRYDANGERILKSSDMGELEYVSASYVVRNGTIVSKHVFAGNGRVASTVGNLTDEGKTTTNSVLYYHPDHLGSSSYVTDKQGRFYEAIEYLPYGETLFNERTESDGVSYKYTGKEEDAETGLYYYGARYYDARLCRWISVDPILESYLGGKPAGGVYESSNIALYGYCKSNPINYIDPNGEYVGVDDLIFTGGGLLVGLAAQGISDAIHGELSNGEDYLGAAVGGAVAGELLLYTGPIVAGAGGAATCNAIKQGIKKARGIQDEFSVKSLAVDTAIGAATGVIPGPKIIPRSAGRGNYNSIYRQMTKKAADGTIHSMRWSTAGKMFSGRATDTNFYLGTFVGSEASLGVSDMIGPENRSEQPSLTYGPEEFVSGARNAPDKYQFGWGAPEFDRSGK